MRTSEELVEIQHRLEAAGVTTRRGWRGVLLRASDQVLGDDPDRALWEIYVFNEDIEDDHDHGDRGEHGDPMATSTSGQQEAREGNRHMGGAVQEGGAPALAWSHRLTEAVPARIPRDDNSVREIQLEGTINGDPAAPYRAG